MNEPSDMLSGMLSDIEDGNREKPHYDDWMERRRKRLAPLVERFDKLAADGMRDDNRDLDGHCRYDAAWMGPCDRPTVEGTRWCALHVDEWCSCGRHATHETNDTFGAFTCGYPECDQCGRNHARREGDE